MARRLIGLSIADRDHLPARCSNCVFWDPVRAATRVRVGCARVAADWVRTVAAEWGESCRVAVEDGAFLGFIKYAPPAYLRRRGHAVRPTARECTADRLHAPGAQGATPWPRRRTARAAFRDLAARESGRQDVRARARYGLRDAPMVGVEFLLRNGFTVVRPHPEVPLLKLDLKSLVSWSDNLEAVLESLRIPVRVPKRAPTRVFTPFFTLYESAAPSSESARTGYAASLTRTVLRMACGPSMARRRPRRRPPTRSAASWAESF